MDIKEANEIVQSVISELIGSEKEITADMTLIGGDALLDSMKLVELCLLLEDKADELGFEFDWTSDATMSKSHSMFRTAATLTEEFARQAGEN